MNIYRVDGNKNKSEKIAIMCSGERMNERIFLCLQAVDGFYALKCIEIKRITSLSTPFVMRQQLRRPLLCGVARTDSCHAPTMSLGSCDFPLYLSVCVLLNWNNFMFR